MKVAVLAHSFPRFPGDTHGPFVKRLSEELARHGHEVHALVPWDPEIRPDPDTPLTLHSFRYAWPDGLHLLGYSRTLKRDVGMRLSSYLLSPLYFLAAERALDRLVRREGIELLHAHWLLPNGYVAARVARRHRLPLAITLHGSDVFMAERNRLFSAMARSTVAAASHVTSCSGDLEQRLAALAGDADDAGKILLVPNGTDLVPRPDGDTEGAAEGAAEGDTEGDGAGRRVRERHGLPADAPLIVAVGRLVDKKGFSYLLDAVAAVAAEHPAVHLALGGGGELLEPLTAQAEALSIADRVTFTGPLAHGEVLELIAAGDLFAMPSVRDPRGNIDGLPIVVLEAMAAGKPVVASRVAGMPLAIDHGVHGLLVPEKDPAALAEAIGRLLAEPAEAAALGAAGRRRVEEELNWSAVAAVHDRLYRRAAPGGRRPAAESDAESDAESAEPAAESDEPAGRGAGRGL